MTTLTAAGLDTLLAELGLQHPLPPSSYPTVLSRPCDIYRAHLADLCAQLLECDIGLSHEAIASPTTRDNGDLSLVIPKLGLGASRAGDVIRDSLQNFKSALFLLPWADSVHLRFFFSLRTLPQLILTYIHDRGDGYGRDPATGLSDEPSSIDKARKKVVIDFSSPNLASEFTPAHLRSTIIGAQLANLYECMGWDVVRLNYLGDWGKDVGLLAVGWERFGSQEAFDQDPMGHLLEVHEKINGLFKAEKDTRTKVRDENGNTAAVESQGIYAERDAFFKRMEDGEAEAVDLWKRIHAANVDYFKATYARLGITFDEISGESQVKPSTMEEVERTLKEKQVYECSEDSWIIDYSKHGPRSLGVSVLRGRTGTSSYLLRDIAAAIDRHDTYDFDKMIYLVAQDQDVHFQKVFQSLRYMGRDDLASKLEHVGFGKVSGMSPQLGKVHLLGDILSQSIHAIRDVLGTDPEHQGHVENNEELAVAFGVSALIAQDAANRRATSYKFNTKKMISLEGGTGPYLQSTFARLSTKVSDANLDETSFKNLDYLFIQEEPWTDVLRLMVQYPDVVATSFKNHEPSVILDYLGRLTNEIMNECLCEDGEDDEGEGSSDPEPPEAMLAQGFLYKYALQVLKNGMVLLSLPLIKK
ncbi:arginyl-tRNA synthetase [Xylariaceae sp. FL1019]|nr:arginyl-tRNA synthetase [Xylariaceae sp. FL1019]